MMRPHHSPHRVTEPSSLSSSRPHQRLMRGGPAVLALALAACGGKHVEPIGNTQGGGPGAHVRDDVDGDGRADTVSLSGRTITMGKVSVNVSDSIEDAPDGTARIVDLGPRAYVAFEWLPEEEEDPPLEWFLYEWRQGTLVPIGSMPAGDLPGDGTVVSSISGCGQETTYRYRVVDGKIEFDEKTVGTFLEDECFACPHVLVNTGDGLRFVGEALRNLSSPALETEDALPLPPIAGQRELTVVLAEVKPETTYLDSLVVDFGGVRVSPRACAGAACAADGQYEIFTVRERRRFVFDVPPGFAGTPVLYARGYYVRFASSDAP